MQSQVGKKYNYDIFTFLNLVLQNKNLIITRCGVFVFTFITVLLIII